MESLASIVLEGRHLLHNVKGDGREVNRAQKSQLTQIWKIWKEFLERGDI
jgi:hypothetical protein